MQMYKNLFLMQGLFAIFFSLVVIGMESMPLGRSD